MSLLKHIISAVLIGVCFHITNAQYISTHSFNDLYDFNEKTIYSLAQDKDGHIWIGTSNGLYQFDGKIFKHYSPTKYDIECSNIKIDNYNRVWFSNFGGQLFCLEEDSLKVIIKEPYDQTYIANYFVLNKDELYYSSHSKSITYYNMKSEQDSVLFECPDYISITNSFETENGFSFFVEENILSTQQRSVTIYEFIDNKTISAYATFETEFASCKSFSGKLGNKYYHIQNHSRQNFCLITDNESNCLHSPGFTNQEVNQYKIYDSSKVLMLGTKYIYAFYPKNDSILSHKWSTIKNSSYLLKDREDNLWIATLDKGIFIQTNPAIRTYKVSQTEVISQLEGLGHHGFAYVTDEGNLYLLDPKKGLQSKLIISDLNPNFIIGFNKFEQTLQLPSKLEYYDLTTNEIKQGLHTYYFKKLHALDTETAILTGDRLSVISTNTDYEVTQLKYQFDFTNIVKSTFFEAITPLNRCNHITEESNLNHLYVNHTDGLKHYSSKGTVENLYYDGVPIFVSAMTSDSSSGVWVASNSGHVHRIQNGFITKSFEIGNAAIDIQGSDSLAYALTNDGIIRIDLATEEKTLINQNDGLIQEEIVRIMLIEDSLWIWGQHHLQKLPLSYSKGNDIPPTIEVNKFNVNEISQSIEDNIILNPSENNIEFHFSAISIKSQKQITYYYRIEELSKEWEITSYDAPFARFSQLAPGNYTFQVKVCNEDMVFSDTVSIKFTIDKPYYQKWWFFALIGLFTIGVLATITTVRIKAINKNNQLKNEKERFKKEAYKAKITAIRAQMNPHFMFNALNTIQEFIVTNQSNVASEYLADFADLMRQYLNQSKVDQITLQEEIETMEIYLRLENLRFNGDLHYQIKIDSSIDQFSTTIPVMLMQPYVENAIKHGLLHKDGNKSLTINILKEKNGLLIEIEDNGIGRQAANLLNRNKSKKHQSFASSATEERIKLVNQSADYLLEIVYDDLEDSGKALGTKVSIQIERNL